MNISLAVFPLTRLMHNWKLQSERVIYTNFERKLRNIAEKV